MTALEQAKALANQITEAKKEAVRTGANKVTFDVYGKPRTQYYYSLKWNDRPSEISDYKGI